jgi:hypothetical protein
MNREVCDPFTVYQEDWTWLEKHPLVDPEKDYSRRLKTEWDESFFNHIWNHLPTGMITLDWMKDWCRTHLRNRLVVGSFRYGKLIDEKFMNYDYEVSCWQREIFGWESETIEPFLDLFNFQYLGWRKATALGEKTSSEWIKRCVATLQKIDLVKNVYKWPIGSTDDGIHAKEES